MITPTQIASFLLEVEAVKLQPNNPFTWASGLNSPIYCDNRVILSYPKIRDVVKIALIENAKDFAPFDVIAGVATAGIPHGALLADNLHLPFVYVRSKPKGHGRQNQIEGKLESGKRVLVIEDLISTGKSSLEAVEVLRSMDVEVTGVLSIFDYKLEASGTNFKNANCKHKSLTTYPVLVEVARKLKYISDADLKILSKWNADPKVWSDTHA